MLLLLVFVINGAVGADVEVSFHPVSPSHPHPVGGLEQRAISYTARQFDIGMTVLFLFCQMLILLSKVLL